MLRLVSAGLPLGLVLLFGAATASAQCTGDCNRDGRVTVAELVRAVNVALGTTPIAMCASLDRNGDDLASVDELVGAVNSSVFSCPIFPADYRDRFTEVRDCRNSIEHGSVSVRILANGIAADAYLANAPTLPVGSIILKEEFDGPDCCNDDELVRWRVMRKESPGFDPEDGDWHWQWVSPNRTVIFDDKDTCISCHQEKECLARDYMCTEGGAPRGRLVSVLEELPGSVMSVAGTGPDDVFVVGAETEDGLGPQVYHYDGESWERLLTGAIVEGEPCQLDGRCDLWWISVTPIDGSFYMVGDGGLILEYDLTKKTFTRHTTPGDALLFGIWGPSEDNLFAVGDTRSVKDPAGVVWRFDGKQWTVDPVTGTTPPLNKVWGTSGTDVHAVGQQGVIIRFDGESWLDVVSDSDRPLFTVHGGGPVVAAVGGFFEPGVILEKSGDLFLDVSVPRTLQLNGVFLPPDGAGVAVGREGSVAVRSGSCWEPRPSGIDTILDFHAVWIDPDGGIWAVGGDLSVDLSEGMVAYGGERTIGSEIRPAAKSVLRTAK